AFDAWYVYEAAAGGIAAVPLNLRGQAAPRRDAAGIPHCAEGLPMVARGEFAHEDGYPAGRFGCPLLHPRSPDLVCAHPQFAKGGCTRIVNLSLGGQRRVHLDRTARAYAAIYDQ